MNISLKERFWLARKAFTGYFTDLPQDGIGMELLKKIYPVAGGEPPVRTAKAHLDGYSSMPWVRALAGKVGYSVATAKWRLYVKQREKPTGGRTAVKDDQVISIQKSCGLARRKALDSLRNTGELKEIESHPLLDFLDNGNTLMKGFSIKKLAQISLDLVGEAFWIKERNPLGIPMRAWPLPAHWVIATPTPSQPTYRVSFRGFQGLIPETEVLYLRDPNPAHPYGRGTGLMMSVSDELEIDEYAAKHLKAFFYNRARPDFVVYPKSSPSTLGRLDPSEVRRLEKDWQDKNAGFWRAFKPYFMTTEVGVHEFQQNFQQMQYTEIRGQQRDICLNVWGVPPEILGVLEQSNRATIEAAEVFFGRWCVEPRLEFLRSELQALLVPEYDEGKNRLILDYDSPVQEDKEYQAKILAQAPEVFTVNEIREMACLAPLDGPQGEVHLKRGTFSFVETLEEQDPVDLARQMAQATGKLDATGQPTNQASTEDEPPNQLGKVAKFLLDYAGKLE